MSTAIDIGNPNGNVNQSSLKMNILYQKVYAVSVIMIWDVALSLNVIMTVLIPIHM